MALVLNESEDFPEAFDQIKDDALSDISKKLRKENEIYYKRECKNKCLFSLIIILVLGIITYLIYHYYHGTIKSKDFQMELLNNHTELIASIEKKFSTFQNMIEAIKEENKQLKQEMVKLKNEKDNQAEIIANLTEEIKMLKINDNKEEMSNDINEIKTEITKLTQRPNRIITKHNIDSSGLQVTLFNNNYLALSIKDYSVSINGMNLYPVSNKYTFSRTGEYTVIITFYKNITKMQFLFDSSKTLIYLDLSEMIGDYVEDIGAMVRQCTKLKTVNFNNFNTSSVEQMGSVFEYAASITSLDLSGFNTSKVLSMGNMFLGMTSLVSLDLSNFDTSSVTDMQGMFAYSTSIKRLDLSNFDTSKVEKMTLMFSGATALTYIDVSSFNLNVYVQVDDMFLNVPDKSSVTIRYNSKKNQDRMIRLIKEKSYWYKINLANQ